MIEFLITYLNQGSPLKALLLVAHGSRRAASNKEVEILANALTLRATDQYDIVKAAFLELTTPTIEEAITECVEAGATTITILPYFLNSGIHVTTDIPNIVNQASAKYPHILINITPHFGQSEQMVELLLDAAIQ